MRNAKDAPGGRASIGMVADNLLYHNKPVRSDDGNTCELQELVPDPYDIIADVAACSDIYTAIDKLPDTQREIMRMRAAGLTQSAIADNFGRSRARISRIACQARKAMGHG